MALSQSTDWVGYGLYLDLVADLKSGRASTAFPWGEKKIACAMRSRLAREGKDVALVCSGDAGIYAMAALVYEVIDLEPCRIAVNVIPGISAFQAAAAKAGAMIGHDFCCISLSDLLTPWEAIERRVKAAAEGDFVISFYNPRSLKRRDQLERAFAILNQHRPADTPVIIASNLGRPEEKVKIVRFADFNPDDVDMLTLVMVGSSQSKSLTRGDGKATPTRRAAMPRREKQRNDRPFHRRRPRRARPHHRARAEADPVLPGLPLCRFAGAGGDRQGGPEGARVIDTAPLTLDEIIAEIEAAHAKGQDVARVHSGDPSLYGAIAEQIRRLEKLGIEYDVTPGVPAFAAAAAELRTEFTLPEIAQTVILTRTAMQASAMPPGETLEELGRSKATLAIHLSIRNLAYIERALTPHYGADCPVVVAYRITWPDQQIIRGTLSTIAKKCARRSSPAPR